jgi:hypothetical protein
MRRAKTAAARREPPPTDVSAAKIAILVPPLLRELPTLLVKRLIGCNREKKTLVRTSTPILALLSPLVPFAPNPIRTDLSSR